MFAKRKMKYNPTHIAHICKSLQPARRPKFAKECNFADAHGDNNEIYPYF